MLFHSLHYSVAELVYLVLSFLLQMFADSSSFLQARQVGIHLQVRQVGIHLSDHRFLGEMAGNHNAVDQDSWHIQKESIPTCCTVFIYLLVLQHVSA
jgi:hypothetical protein